MASEVSTTYVWPSLSARNARALIDFGMRGGVRLHDLGALRRRRPRRPLRDLWPLGGGIMLGDERADEGGDALQSRTFGVYVVTDNPDVLHDRALAAGATLVRALNDTDYGSRELRRSYPEGNLWSFGTYRGAEHSHPH